MSLTCAFFRGYLKDGGTNIFGSSSGIVIRMTCNMTHFDLTWYSNSGQILTASSNFVLDFVGQVGNQLIRLGKN